MYHVPAGHATVSSNRLPRSHVPHMNESCPTYEPVMSHTGPCRDVSSSPITGMLKGVARYTHISYTYTC